jgi:ADP-ribose pyrophosphatase YjhB (NUDIX family)
LFGSLRVSLALIHRNGTFLVIHRNDGRGLCLPGGFVGWRENLDAAVRREVVEETGLHATSAVLKKNYHSNADLPCNISVFEVEAEGELLESWEGTPRWLSIPELEPQLLASQRPVLELMHAIRAGASQK